MIDTCLMLQEIREHNFKCKARWMCIFSLKSNEEYILLRKRKQFCCKEGLIVSELERVNIGQEYRTKEFFGKKKGALCVVKLAKYYKALKNKL